MKLYMFRAVPLPIIRSLFTVHSPMIYVIYTFEDDQDGTEFHPGPARKLSTNMYDIYIAECTVNKLLMMGTGTARNM